MNKQPKNNVDNLSNKSEIISPQEYSEFIKQIDLISIRLVSSKTEYSNKIQIHIPKNLNAQIDRKISFDTPSESITTLRVEYNLKMTEGKSPYLAIFTKWLCIYSYKDIPFDDDYLAIFQKHTLPFHLYPYFRQYVQQETNWAGYPPITLPFLKFTK